MPHRRRSSARQPTRRHATSPLGFAGTKLFSWRAKLGLMGEPWRRRGPIDLEESVADFVARRLGKQIDILHRRASILRVSITLGAITVLLVAVLILALFV